MWEVWGGLLLSAEPGSGAQDKGLTRWGMGREIPHLGLSAKSLPAQLCSTSPGGRGYAVCFQGCMDTPKSPPLANEEVCTDQKHD